MDNQTEYTELEQRATAFVFGELPDDESRHFAEELEQSPELEKLVASIRDAVGALESEFAGETEGVTAADRSRIETAMAAASTPSPVTSANPGNVWLIRFAVAAVVLIAVGLAAPGIRNALEPSVASTELRDQISMIEAQNQRLQEALAKEEAAREEAEAEILQMNAKLRAEAEKAQQNTSTTRELAENKRKLQRQLSVLQEGESGDARGRAEMPVEEEESELRLAELGSQRTQEKVSFDQNKVAEVGQNLGPAVGPGDNQSGQPGGQQSGDQQQSGGEQQAGGQQQGQQQDAKGLSLAQSSDQSGITEGMSLGRQAADKEKAIAGKAIRNGQRQGQQPSQPESGRAGGLGFVPAPVEDEARRNAAESKLGATPLFATPTAGTPISAGVSPDAGAIRDGYDRLSALPTPVSPPSQPTRRSKDGGWRYAGQARGGTAINLEEKIVTRGKAEQMQQFAEQTRGFGIGGGGFGGEVAKVERFREVERLSKLRALEQPSGDRFAAIQDNAFETVGDAPLSTFSIDVDTASYSKVRMYLNQHNRLPDPNAVRIEEMVNYFRYEYQPPKDERPFSAAMEIASCPWNSEHRLARIGIKGKVIEQERPASNLVFLLDVSGSMNRPNKHPLVIKGMKMLTEQLSENDSVAIVVYAGAAGVVLESTTGDKQKTIIDSLDRLRAGGSTNGGQGIQLAYQIARDNFIPGGTNRVILCTDGDFNVGVTDNNQLTSIAEENAKSDIFLSVLGFGIGNHNDSMMEQISNKGNGNYAFIDTEDEARKVFVEQLQATLITIAKDVKIQVEFNPAEVSSYRLIGYENRMLAAKDFNDDTKDAGEIGAGHTVTAIYELVPAKKHADNGEPPRKAIDDLKYQRNVRLTEKADSGEWLTLKLRYKQPTGDTSTLMEFPVKDDGKTLNQADRDFQFAASVAAFGMLLRQSPHKGNANFEMVEELASGAAAKDEMGYRDEFVSLVRKARSLSGQ